MELILISLVRLHVVSISFGVLHLDLHVYHGRSISAWCPIRLAYRGIGNCPRILPNSVHSDCISRPCHFLFLLCIYSHIYSHTYPLYVCVSFVLLMTCALIAFALNERRNG